MSSLGLIFLLATFNSFSQAWLIRRRANCITKTTCTSCTNHKSWSGKPCRWCPRDNKCHAYGAILTNPCSRSANIVKPSSCSNIAARTYDASLAYKMVFLSALSYADHVANFIPKAKVVNTFRLVKQVTTSCPGNAQCSGYVAVSNAEKAIAIAFRGSEHTGQVVKQALEILTTPKSRFAAGGKVQQYFEREFQRIWNGLKPTLYQQIRNNPLFEVWVTGHSLGGAMASLASTMIRYESMTAKNNLLLYTFGQPRVGNYDYALAHDRLVPISFRVTHFRDLVVHLPTCRKVGLICVAPFGGPYHHGKEIYYGQEYMTRSSSYKECNGLPHNEDLSCSNKLSVWAKCFTVSGVNRCINDHINYFQINVGTWWKKYKG